MARTRYTKYESFALGGDLLSTAICIDVVPFPYANDTVASGATLGYSKDGDSITLAPIGFEVSPIKVAVSSSGVADEATVDNLSLKIYDINNAVWTIFENVIKNYAAQRLQFVIWENSSGAMQPRFYGIDIGSIQPEVNTILFNNTSYDICISCTAIELGKQVLQDTQTIPCEAVALAVEGNQSATSVDVYKIIFQAGTTAANIFSDTSGNLTVGWSPEQVLAYLQNPANMPNSYKYFVTCLLVNNYNPAPTPGLDQSGNVYILGINYTQLALDHPTIKPVTGYLNSGAANDPNVNPGTGVNTFYTFVSAFNSGSWPAATNIAVSYNVVNSLGGASPLRPQDFAILDQIDARLLANSQYINPSNVYLPFYFYAITNFNGGKFPTLATNYFASFLNTLTAIAYLIRLATDITNTETVTSNIDWLGAKAVKPTDSTTHFGYGAGYEISTTTGLGTSTLANNIALNRSLLVNANNPTEYCLSNQATLYDALKLMCDSILGFPYLTYTSGTLNLKIFSMLSASYPTLIAGNPELIPFEKISKVKSCAFMTDTASVGIKKPQGANPPWTQNDDGSGAGDILSTQFNSPSSHNGSNVSGTSMFGTFWNNWTPTGIAGGNIAWLENSMMLFATALSSTDVYEASYCMFNKSLQSDPLYVASTGVSSCYVFVANQGFGGGTLQGGNVVLAYYPHWQFALCGGIFSLFCIPQNSELIETEVALTLAMINALRVNPIAAKVALRTLALKNFLTMSVEYNFMDYSRTLKLTAVRNR